MCGHCLFTLILFFEVKERQIRIGRMDLSPGDLPSGESTFGRNDLVPPDIRVVWTTKRQAIFGLLVRVG